MAEANRSSKVVFVGNIPYDTTEEELISIFKTVGTVVSFRLVFDRETGKAKGYGFCEYTDPETARSSIRNLNNVDLRGRSLRVDYADFELGTPKEVRKEAKASGTASQRIASTRRKAEDGIEMHHIDDHSEDEDHLSLPPQQLSSISHDENVEQAIKQIPPNQLASILTQTKQLVQNHPEQARQLLQSNPQLTFSLFHILWKLDLIEPSVIQRIIQKSSAEQPIAATLSTATSTLSSEQKQFLDRIMTMTQQQIHSLPQEQREKVLLLRTQLGSRK